MTAPKGVWVTGPSRSGTSLTAGLLAKHGVFWGEPSCRPLPDQYNPRGYFEHTELSRRIKTDDFTDWPEAWWRALEADGWNGKTPWGVKRGPRAWPWVRILEPSLVIVTQRPHGQVQASRARWTGRKNLHDMHVQVELLQKVLDEVACPVVRVNTHQLIRGRYRQIKKAFRQLGVSFDKRIAENWIDPTLWNRGLK